MAVSTTKTPQPTVPSDQPTRTTLGKLWNLLTAPNPNLEGMQNQSQARLISGLMAGLIPVSVFALVLFPILAGYSIDPTELAFVIIQIGLFALSRTKYVAIAGRLFIALISIFVFRNGLIVGGMTAVSRYSLVLLPLILVSVWYSARDTVVASISLLVALLATPYLQNLLDPSLPAPTSLLVPSMLLAASTTLIVIFGNYRDQLERIRKRELESALAKAETANETLSVANTQLARANKLAKETTRLKSEFMSTMSHELRTPLNAIHGFCGIMLSGMGGEVDEDAMHMLSRIDANSSRLLGLINSVLDIAKIEAGRMELINAPMAIKELVERWKSQMGVLAEEKKLAFSTLIDPTLPKQVVGDAERLTQIVTNLLSNAFKFTEEGSVLLELKRQGEQWQILVTDTGVGIPPHALNYIFDEFRQVDGSSTRSFGGTGLGLSIVRNMAQMMNGGVKVSSELGKGSTFIVTLPLIEGTKEHSKEEKKSNLAIAVA